MIKMRNIAISKYFIIFMIILSIIFFGAFYSQLKTQISKNIHDNNTTYFYILYSTPTTVNTSLFVNGKLVIELSNFTFKKFPPVSEYGEMNLTEGEHKIEIYEKNYNLSKIEKIYIKEKRVIVIFIDIENKSINIKSFQNKPNFE